MKDIQELLRSLDENERKQALVLLSRTPTRENLAIIQNLAENDPHSDVRFLAKRALNLIQSNAGTAPRPEAATPLNEQKLKEYLEGNEHEKLAAIRHVVVNSLKQALPLILERLPKESDPAALSSLIMAVGKLGTAATFPHILPFLANQNQRVKASAVEAAGMLGSPQAYPSILKLLDDPDNRVRGNAAIAVKNLGPANITKVIRAMVDSKQANMKSTAAYVLRFFPEDTNVDILTPLLASSDINVRNNALKTLSVYNEKGIARAGAVLASLGSDAQPQKETMEALEKILPGSQPPLPMQAKTENLEIDDSLPADFIGLSGRGPLAAHLKPYAQQHPSEPSPECSLDQILVWARTIKASDVHISPSKPILYRQFGQLKTLSTAAFTVEQTRTLIDKSRIDPGKLKWFYQHGDMETVIVITGAGRFRVTLMKHLTGFNITVRVIPWNIRTFEESGMPSSCKDLTKWAQGLVLITGPVGSGKTSTLATFVEMINQDRCGHIVTIEKPIEFTFESAKCQVSQREIGCHSLSQTNALKGALREDPDILVVSELRDLESMQLAISAAETGHLVFGTMNTINAARTISRLTDSYPPEDQAMLQNMLSESLRGIICQQLVPRKDGTGVVPAYEVLIVTTAVSNMIRKEGIHQLASVMTLGKSAGMVTIDKSLHDLLDAGIISGEEAYARAEVKRDFEKFRPRKG